MKKTISLFGTDGIRQKPGQSPFTQKELTLLGNAIGHWAVQKYGASPTVLIISDTRASVSWLKANLLAGLLTYPITVLDGGVLPTPAGAHLMKKLPEINATIVISALHNHWTDNGIKIIDAKNGKLPKSDETAISNAFYQELTSNYSQFGVWKPFNNAPELYINSVLSFIKPDILKNKTVVLDCAYGATSSVAPAILSALGATVIPIFHKPNGYNINDDCGAVHTQALQEAVLKNKADIGFAFDGDGDRLIAVNKNGELKDGDDILIILSTHPKYQAQNTLVGTVMSNEGIVAHLTQQNKKLVRTPVGDKFIAEHLTTNNLWIGAEPSGHIIVADCIPTGDGILAALKLLEAIAHTDNWLMKSFNKFPQALINLPVKEKKDLTSEPISHYLASAQADLPHGRILVRYSGTESVLRIMVEAPTQDLAHEKATTLAGKFKQEIG